MSKEKRDKYYLRSSEEVKYITMFEAITGVKVKDCIQVDDTMGFLIEQGYMGLAIGKSGNTIKKVSKSIGKKNILVMEFSEDQVSFVKNLFQPVEVRQVIIDDSNNDKVATVEVLKSDRVKVLGHKGKRIKIAKELLNRHCGISDIIVKTVQTKTNKQIKKPENLIADEKGKIVRLEPEIVSNTKEKLHSAVDTKREEKEEREIVSNTKEKLRLEGVVEDLSDDLSANITPEKIKQVVGVYKRNQKLVVKLKEKYSGRCQICNDTFEKKGGGVYSEAHHLIPLGEMGYDAEDNIVILCPTCHKKLHFAKEVKIDESKGGMRAVMINGVCLDIKY